MNILMRISVLVLGVLVLLYILILMAFSNAQVLLILLETRTSIVLFTDMNTDIGANINIAKKCTSLIQMESTSAYDHMYVLIIYSY